MQNKAHAALLAALLCLSLAGGALAAVSISGGPTQNMTCSGGVCTPAGKKAVLNVSYLASLLAGGDWKVTTGSGAITIEVTDNLTWASTNTLTLDAAYNVSIKALVTVTGGGGLTVLTSDGIGGGNFLFFPGGKIDFNQLSSILAINGENYTLESDVHTLAANNSGFVALANDYDAHVDGPYLSSPISGFGGGVLEGLGHTISNLTIKNKSTTVCAAGFIGGVNAGGAVRNFNLTNARVSNAGGAPLCGFFYIGALVAQNAGVVFGSRVTGKVRGGGAAFAGGLVGENLGTITGSSTDMLVDGSSSVSVNGPVANGGLVGRNETNGIVLLRLPQVGREAPVFWLWAG